MSASPDRPSRVDVVIPCYNYGRFLRASVASVLEQPGVDVRVLIIDDCSSDETPDIGYDLARDPRVSYRRHAQNAGHIATYNEGLLGWASGDYCLLLSADDLLAPGALARATRVLDAHGNVGLCYGRQQLFAIDPPDLSHLATARAACELTAGREFIETCCRGAANIVGTPTAVVRTSVQQSVGGYRADLPHTGDFEMWLRIASWSAVAWVDAVQAFKRMHESNMQHQYVATALPDLQQRQAAFERAFETIGERMSDSGALLDEALAALADEAFWTASRAFDRGDATGCATVLEFALALKPELRETPHYRRLAWKRRMGHATWAIAAPLVSRLRKPATRGGR